MAIVWIILVVLLCIHLACGVCPTPGKSGPGCVYDCHCQYSGYCDQSSNCQGQCQAGWRGMTCQQENAALGKPTESSGVNSPNQGSDRAVNGVKNTDHVYEFHTSYNASNPPTSVWWSVDLKSMMSVQEVIISFRINYKYRRNGLRIYTSTTKPTVADTSTWGQSCYNVNGWNNGSNIPNELSILACMGTWRYLFIYTITDNGGGVVLDFTEVEIYGDCSSGTYGTNCSQFCDVCNSDGCQSTGQCVTGCSTFRYGAGCSMFCYDCNSEGCHSNGDCRTGCRTGRYGADCSLTCDGCNIEGCNRNGQCISGCKNGRMPFPSCNQICPGGFYWTNCAKLCSQRGCREPSNSCDPEDGKCVNFCRNSFIGTDCGDCEEGWYGDCDKQCSNRQCASPQISTYCTRYTGDCNPAGCRLGWRNNDCSTACAQNTYGLNCSKLCSDRKCLDPSSPCDRGTGVCVGGCTAGYTGSDCGQCSINVYGENCSKDCSSRYCLDTSTSCDRLTGTCTGGSQDGWIETQSAFGRWAIVGIGWQVCPSGTYGSGCSSICGNCAGDDICDHVTGTCPGDCNPGWRGRQCKQACPSGTYGPDCNSICGNCTGDVICDHVTGNCPGGCKPGWRGSRCKQNCDREHYGSNCARTCTHRHCIIVSSCSPSTGACEGECQSGWAGTDCMEASAVKSSPAVDQTPVVVGTVAAVIVIILIVVVAVIIWIRKKRRSGSEAKSDHVYYNTVTSEVNVPGSEVSQSLPVGHYDSIDAISRDDGATYTTIGPLDQGEGVCVPRPVSDVTVRDEYEPVAEKTYEKLTSTSRDNDDDYTGLERRNSYENVR